jgi:hypothetical protein
MVNRASNVDEVKEILKNYQFELEKEILWYQSQKNKKY